MRTFPRRPMSRGRRAVLLTALALAAGACRNVRGEFVWADAYSEPPGADPSYVIAPGDAINIRVYNHDGLSGRARVRHDGMISLPFLNDIQAAGMTPTALAQKLQVRLKDYIVNPVVSVSLEEPRPFEVPVVGEVTRPGTYRLEPGVGVLAALAAAGGLNEFANREAIFVLRGSGIRIRFTFRDLTQAAGKARGFVLRSGDIVMAE